MSETKVKSAKALAKEEERKLNRETIDNQIKEIYESENKGKGIVVMVESRGKPRKIYQIEKITTIKKKDELIYVLHLFDTVETLIKRWEVEWRVYSKFKCDPVITQKLIEIKKPTMFEICENGEYISYYRNNPEY